jgi:hypothetical protein
MTRSCVRLTRWLIAAYFVSCMVPNAVGNPSDSVTGIWSAAGQPSQFSPQTSSREIAAPDNARSVRITADGVFLASRHEVIALKEVVASPGLVEVLWSPDSKAVAITASDGGLVGTWMPYIYVFDANDHPRYQSAFDLIAPLVGNFARCEQRETPNSGAVKWLRGGEELLLVVEVPPHSSCRNMGAIEGFRISIKDWRVVGRIGGAAVRRDWRDALGSRLREEGGN